MVVYSPKQRAVLQLRHRPHVHYHLYDGAVRSGKTFSAVAGFVNWALSIPATHPFLVSSKTYAQVRDVVVPEFGNYAESIGAPFKEKRNENKFFILDREFHFRDGGSYDASGKIKSFTYRGVYLDEVTEMKEEYVSMAASRCITYDDFKVVMTCNPDGPAHWAKLHYVDTAAIDERYERIPFTLYDNPILTIEGLEDLVARFSELWRRRMLRGEWAAATGAVYPYFTLREHPENQRIALRWVGMDTALSGINHAILFEQHGQNVYAIDEWRHDGHAQGPLRLDRHAGEIDRWLNGRRVAAVCIDPASPNAVKHDLAQRLEVPVINATNDIAPGINATASWLEHERLFISPELRETRLELDAYVWDENAANRGEDVPIKTNDHAMDAMRYGVATYPKLVQFLRRGEQLPHSMDEKGKAA